MGGGSSTTQTTQNQQQVQTPQTPDYAADPVKNYYSGVGNYQATDPYAFVTPANALQTGAFQNAGGLFQSGSLYGQAAQGAKNVMNAAPTTYTAGFNGAATANLGPAAQTTATGYQAPSMGPAAQVQSPLLGQAAQASAPNLGPASQATASLAGSATQAGPVNLSGQATQAQSASLLDNLDAYRNPAQQQLVDTTLAGMDDNAARVRAAQQAQFARSGAFGGSRAAITQAQTESDLARERGLAQANLNTQAWNAATQLSGQDAANRQQASLFNANAQNQRDETRAGLDANLGMFNAGQQNDRDALNANLGTNVNLANMNAANDFGIRGAELGQQTALANMEAQNDFALRGADLQQQASLFNAGAVNDNARAQAGLDADAGRFGAEAQNAASLWNAGANNQYDLARFGAQNDANMANATAANDMAKFNTTTLNDAQQQQLARQLQGSALLGDIAGQYAGDYRADLAMQSDLGNQLYQLQDRYTQAPLTQIQNVGNLMNPGLIQSLSGQTITSQQSGVDQTKKSGGLLNGLLGVASLGAKFIPSDRRLKRNIEKIGEEADGLGRYRWNYAWGDMVWPEASEGVMADEVARLRPWALGPDKAGYATVNYGAL